MSIQDIVKRSIRR